MQPAYPHRPGHGAPPSPPRPSTVREAAAGAPGPRAVDVAPARLPAWVGGFLDAHGAGEWTRDGDDVVVRAADGASARLVAPVPGALAGVTSLRTLVGRPVAVTTAVLLVRRGGYAVGVAHGGELLDARCGTRYVQGRTAAGGWSQQRYQRRRENQAQALVDAVADAAASRLVHRPDILRLVTGGDRLLLGRVLSDARLIDLAALPRTQVGDVPEPRRAVLADVARRADAVRVVVTAGPEPGPTTTDHKENPVPTSRELMPTATSVLVDLVERVPAAAWDRPSPDAGWTARDVLNHLTAEQLWVPHLLRGESVEQVGDRYDGDVLGDDPVAAFRSASEAAVEAFTESVTHPATDAVHASSGPMEIKEYAKQRLVDTVVHGWDIAKATATSYEPDAQSVDKALAYMRPHVGPDGVPGVFDAPVPTTSTNRLDQLVALLGRDPNWRP